MDFKKLKSLLPQFPFLKDLIKEDKIYIFSTKHGFYYIAIIFILFIISLTYGHSLAFTATFVFVSIINVSAIYTNYNLKGVYLLKKIEQRDYFSNEEFDINFNLKNTSNVDRFDVQLSIGDFESDSSLELTSGQSIDIPLRFQNLSRGIYSIDQVKLWTNFPFGIFYSWKYLFISQKFIVYPKPVNKLDNMPLTLDQAESDEGEVVSLDGVEDFLGHRIYREGDSWKHIDWKVLARQDELLLKEFSSMNKKRVIFDYNSLNNLSKEDRLSQLCYWAIEADKSQIPFGLKLPGIQIDVNQGESHLRKCLNQLGTFESEEIKL